MVATLSGSCLSSPAHHGGGLHETRLARVKAQDKRPTGRRDPLLDAFGVSAPWDSTVAGICGTFLQPMIVAGQRLFVVTGLV